MAKFYLCEDSRSFFIPTHVAPFSRPGRLPVCGLSCGDSRLRKLCKLIPPCRFSSPFSSCESKCRLRWLCWKALLTDLLHKWCWIQRTLKFDSPEFELLLCPLLASWLTSWPLLIRLQNGVYNDLQLIGLTLENKSDNIRATHKDLPRTDNHSYFY